jgi:hypothetical protein
MSQKSSVQTAKMPAERQSKEPMTVKVMSQSGRPRLASLVSGISKAPSLCLNTH